MTEQHPGPARDVSLSEWLHGIGFHPADTETKQLAHELVRQLVALLGTHLHQLLPPGRDKSLTMTELEGVLMRANRALAVGGGPAAGVMLEALQTALADTRRVAEIVHAKVPEDPRIEEYKAEQATPSELRRLTAGDLMDMGWPEQVYAGAKVTAEQMAFARRRWAEGWRPADHQTEPHQTYRAELADSEGSSFVARFVGGDGYAQVGVLAGSHEEAVEAINSDSPSEPGGARGLYFTMDTAEAVQRFVNEVLTAADRAGIGSFTDLTA